jgi:hypothetical protein
MSGWRNPIQSPLNGHASIGQRKPKGPMTWCRRPNGFSDYPKWRAVSARSGLDLCTVLAFVNRLELGNDAVNRGEIRGSIAGFAAEDFAAALSINSENAKKLLETLEHPDIGWIADGMIADFYSRHPETEDPTATERQRRKRSRERILRKLADLARVGLISSGERSEIEKQLPRLDQAELVDLQLRLDEKSLQLPVTRDSRMSQRDSVTVTPDQKDQKITREGGFTTTSGASGNVVGLAREEMISGKTDPNVSQWLKEEAPNFVHQRMGGSLETATKRLQGWCEKVGNAALFEVLQGAKDRKGTAFHLHVADQVMRRANSCAPAGAIGGAGA